MLKFRRKRSGGPGELRPRSHSSYALNHAASHPDTETDTPLPEDSPPTSSPEPEIPSRSRSNTFCGGDVPLTRSKFLSDRNLLQPSSYTEASFLSAGGRERDIHLPLGGRDRNFHLPLGGRERDFHISPGSRDSEVELVTFANPRHFLRRGGVVGNIDVSGIQKTSDGGDNVKVIVEEGSGGRQVTEMVPADNKPLRELLDYIFIKNDLEVDWTPPTHYFMVTMRNGTRTTPDLDLPTRHFAGTVVEIRPLEEEARKEARKLTFSTVQSCLAYFTTHGLVELPLCESGEEGDYHLPRVQPLENIPEAWEDLPIKPEYKKDLTSKQTSQQQAIWELIQTEHSHLKQMGIIINLFMQTLELIRRANVLSRDNYHNVFGGYMEDLYLVHEQFWSWTLWPCLEQVYLSGKLLDVSVIIERFPEEFSNHFEIYEQHCALDAVNLRNLDKAMKHEDFRTYLEWCEAHPKCQRKKLKDFLVIPMQRLTRYPLLFNAILKATLDESIHQQLEHIWNEVDSFVQDVNTVLLAQSETERVRDAMSRITSYTAVDLPGEFKEMMQPYTHLDLLAPMPDVEIDKPRVLMLEGSLKYRDHASKMVAHVFLFTDMLLITKPRKGGEKFSIERQPYQISSLVLHSLEPGSFLVLVVTQYRVLTTWFTLKAATEAVATEWMQTITKAQNMYTEAIKKKAHHWKMLQTLKSERILNGIEHRAKGQNHSIGSAHSYLSRPTLSRGSLTTSTESLEHASPKPHPHPAFIFAGRSLAVPMHRSRSGDIRHQRVLSNPVLTQIKASDYGTGRSGSDPGLPVWLERTASLKTVFESHESPNSGSGNEVPPTHKPIVFPRARSQSLDPSQFHVNRMLRKSSPPPGSPPSSESDMNIHEVGQSDDDEPALPMVTAGFGKWQSTDCNFTELQRQQPIEEEEEGKGEGEREGERVGEGESVREGDGETGGDGKGEDSRRKPRSLGTITESESEDKLLPFKKRMRDANIVVVTPPSPKPKLHTISPSTSHTLTTSHQAPSQENKHDASHEKSHGTTEIDVPRQQSPSHKKPHSHSETSPSHKKPHSHSETSPSHKRSHRDAETSPSHKKPRSHKETTTDENLSSRSPTPKQSPTHKKPHRDAKISPSHKKPHSDVESPSPKTSPSHKRDVKTSPSHKRDVKTSPSHKRDVKTSPSHKKPGFEALTMLGGATVTILASINVKELLAEQNECASVPPSHTVIPTSGASGSDNESVPSPRTQVVECISNVKLGGQHKDGVTTQSSRDSNLKSDTPHIQPKKPNKKVTITAKKTEARPSAYPRNRASKPGSSASTRVATSTSTKVESRSNSLAEKTKVAFSDVVVELREATSLKRPSLPDVPNKRSSKHTRLDVTGQRDKDRPRKSVRVADVGPQTVVSVPKLAPTPLSTPPKLPLPNSSSKRSNVQQRRVASPLSIHKIPPPQNRSTKQSVKELSMLFEQHSMGQALDLPALSFVKISHDVSGCGLGNGMRKSASTPKLDQLGKEDASKETGSLDPSQRQHTEAVRNGKVKGRERNSEMDTMSRTVSLDDLLSSSGQSGRSSLSIKTALPATSRTAISVILAPNMTNVPQRPQSTGKHGSNKTRQTSTGASAPHMTIQLHQQPHRQTEDTLNNGQPRSGQDHSGPPRSVPHSPKVKVPKTDNLSLPQLGNSLVACFGGAAKPIKGILKNAITFHDDETTNPPPTTVGHAPSPGLQQRTLRPAVTQDPSLQATNHVSSNHSPEAVVSNGDPDMSVTGQGGRSEGEKAGRREIGSRRHSIERGRRVEKDRRPLVRKRTDCSNASGNGLHGTLHESGSKIQEPTTKPSGSHDPVRSGAGTVAFNHISKSPDAARSTTSHSKSHDASHDSDRSNSNRIPSNHISKSPDAGRNTASHSKSHDTSHDSDRSNSNRIPSKSHDTSRDSVPHTSSVPHVTHGNLNLAAATATRPTKPISVFQPPSAPPPSRAPPARAQPTPPVRAQSTPPARAQPTPPARAQPTHTQDTSGTEKKHKTHRTPSPSKPVRQGFHSPEHLKKVAPARPTHPSSSATHHYQHPPAGWDHFGLSCRQPSHVTAPRERDGEQQYFPTGSRDNYGILRSMC